MNPRAKIITAGFVLAAGWAALASLAQPGPGLAPLPSAPPATASTNAPSAVPQSTFVLPTADGQGRNPFFPDDSELTSTNPVAAEAPRSVDLVLQGFSGEGAGRIAIINDVNFAVGDREFVASSGGPVAVHCLELKTNSVVVEVNGERRELRFQLDH